MTISESYLITREFHTPNDFSMHIEKYSVEHKCTLMESIIDYCEKSSIDVESIAPLVSKSLKEKLRIERNLGKEKGVLELE